MATVDDYDEVLELWKKRVLSVGMADYKLEIEDDIPKSHVAIALYLDYMTVKASGNTNDFFEGFSKAAKDLLNFLKIEMTQDNEMKIVLIRRSSEYHDTQERLKQYLWGD